MSLAGMPSKSKGKAPKGKATKDALENLKKENEHLLMQNDLLKKQVRRLQRHNAALRAGASRSVIGDSDEEGDQKRFSDSD
jgi:hypothetical protein